MALKHRRITKKGKKEAEKYFTKFDEKKSLNCKECNRFVDGVGPDVIAIICCYCTQKMIVPPVLPKPKKPRTTGDINEIS